MNSSTRLAGAWVAAGFFLALPTTVLADASARAGLSGVMFELVALTDDAVPRSITLDESNTFIAADATQSGLGGGGQTVFGPIGVSLDASFSLPSGLAGGESHLFDDAPGPYRAASGLAWALSGVGEWSARGFGYVFTSRFTLSPHTLLRLHAFGSVSASRGAGNESAAAGAAVWLNSEDDPRTQDDRSGVFIDLVAGPAGSQTIEPTPLTATFVNASSDPMRGYAQAYVESFATISAVPEPSAALLWAGGLAALGVARRLRRPARAT